VLSFSLSHAVLGAELGWEARVYEAVGGAPKISPVFAAAASGDQAKQPIELSSPSNSPPLEVSGPRAAPPVELSGPRMPEAGFEKSGFFFKRFRGWVMNVVHG
jgi:hypothetical protein